MTDREKVPREDPSFAKRPTSKGADVNPPSGDGPEQDVRVVLVCNECGQQTDSQGCANCGHRGATARPVLALDDVETAVCEVCGGKSHEPDSCTFPVDPSLGDYRETPATKRDNDNARYFKSGWDAGYKQAQEDAGVSSAERALPRVVGWVKFDGDEYHEFTYETSDISSIVYHQRIHTGWLPVYVEAHVSQERAT